MIEGVLNTNGESGTATTTIEGKLKPGQRISIVTDPNNTEVPEALYRVRHVGPDLHLHSVRVRRIVVSPI